MRASHRATRGPWVLLLLIIAATFGASTGSSFFIPLPSQDDFNVAAWELRYLPGKWLFVVGRVIEGQPSREEEDATVVRYLDLTARIDRLSALPVGSESSDELARLEDERASIENDVEAVLEGRVTKALEDAGLRSQLPLFPDARWVFPPVDVELAEPPNELVISPRERIELIDQRPLRSDLSPSQIVGIETKEERSGRVSALVEPLAGTATYPSLVRPGASYTSLVELAAHEWLHQYLFFRPLGRNFYDSLKLRTLNETVVTLAAREIAGIVLLTEPLGPPYDSPVAAPPTSNVDLGAVLQQLRLDVDALLAFGQVDAAEALMEQRRLELARQGIVYRRINQAFFAFRNVYATEPGAVDPIGLKVIALRARTGSVGGFLRAAAEFSSEQDLDRALEGG